MGIMNCMIVGNTNTFRYLLPDDVEIVEDVGQQRGLVRLVEDGSFIGQPEDLLQYEQRGLGEQGIDDGMQQSGVLRLRVLVQNDVVLNAEVRHVVGQVHVLREDVHADNLA